MITTNSTCGDTWIEVVSDTDYLLQVRGSTPIELIAGATPTFINAKGITLNPGDVITSQMLQGTLHIHSASRTTTAEYTIAV